MQTYLIGLIVAFGVIAISYIFHFFSTSKNTSNRSSSTTEAYDPWNNNEMSFGLKWGGKNNKRKRRVKYLKN